MSALLLEQEIEKVRASIGRISCTIESLLNERNRKEGKLSGLCQALELLESEKDSKKISLKGPRKGSEIEKMRDIIRESGKPMHVREIYEKLGKQAPLGYISIAGTLNNYSKRRGKIFTSVGPNIFGLKEFSDGAAPN